MKVMFIIEHLIPHGSHNCLPSFSSTQDKNLHRKVIGFHYILHMPLYSINCSAFALQ